MRRPPESMHKLREWGRQRPHLWVLGGLVLILLATRAITLLSPYQAPAPATHQRVQIRQELPTAPIFPTPTTPSAPPAFSPDPRIVAGDWPSYAMSDRRSGFNRDETLLNAQTAPRLQLFWMSHAKGSISSQPVVANGVVYWGSWDGREHATYSYGGEVWDTYLGQTTAAGCDPATIGVASTATIAPIPIGSRKALAVFVGGGDTYFYALDAASGKILWKTALDFQPSAFIWSSPVVYKGSVYVGLASLGDCPPVQGQLIQMNMTTGAIEHLFSVVPDGCLGGGIWGSPTIDDQTGDLYVTTGNPFLCGTTEPYAAALLELRASDLTLVNAWQVPASASVIDNDFGSAPTLFTARMGGVSRSLVGVAHKNGMFYAFIRGSIGDGPVWADSIASGGSCPECGDGSIAPAAWDGHTLYVAGGNTIINGAFCAGSVRALNPATGAFHWEHCLHDGPVLAPVT